MNLIKCYHATFGMWENFNRHENNITMDAVKRNVHSFHSKNPCSLRCQLYSNMIFPSCREEDTYGIQMSLPLIRELCKDSLFAIPHVDTAVFRISLTFACIRELRHRNGLNNRIRNIVLNNLRERECVCVCEDCLSDLK
jgi:hypothetical protein